MYQGPGLLIAFTPVESTQNDGHLQRLSLIGHDHQPPKSFIQRTTVIRFGSVLLWIIR